MPYRNDDFAAGQYYHIYNRGAGNHYHFLLRQETEKSLSRFMQVVFNAYVQALNLQQRRSGALFEGRFRHARVNTWEYLVILCRYIHLNPVRAGLMTRPEDWPH
jgi:putative transposase